MSITKKMIHPSVCPHEWARRQYKCQKQIQFHTKNASLQGLIGLAFLGFGWHYAQKHPVVVPLVAAPSAACAFSKSAASLAKRQLWIKESKKLQRYG